MAKKNKNKNKNPDDSYNKSDLVRGLVIKTTGSIYEVKTADEVLQCRIRGRLRLEGFKSTSPVVVGDYVFVEKRDDGSCLIREIDTRKNCVLRKSQKLSKQKHILACNVDQAVLVVTLVFPETPLEFIDRFLVSATAYNIPAKIVFNKIDLYTDELIEYMEELMDMYASIGYESIAVSALEKINIDKFEAMLKDKISVLAGNSGVGKSTLINAIDPDLELKTGEISYKYLTGRHTTTYSQMFELKFGGYIIDTPGIKGFGLVGLDKQDIAHNFPEMFEYLDKCKFYNCTHIHEPGCAVKEAVEEGKIAYSRYRSYVHMMLDENDKYRKDI